MIGLTRAIGIVLGLALMAIGPAQAQQPVPGGTVRIYLRDSPASASVAEESTRTATVPLMGVFNNLIMFDQQNPVNSEQTLVPDLAQSWAWSDDYLSLTFKLRQGATWHDGKPFAAADVACTFALLRETGTDRLRKNPHKPWFANVADVIVNGPSEVTLRLGRPQPSLLSMLASGYSAIYPCHVSAAKMRTAPVGTGPFRLAAFMQNELVRLERNTAYWKKGRPYLDAIEMPVIASRATAMLAFSAGKVDMSFPGDATPQMAREMLRDAPQARCTFTPMNVGHNLIMNREKPPFDDAGVRRALALALDREAFIRIMFEGKADIGGAILPAPSGVWGMPPEQTRTLFGYDPDIAANRAHARTLMEGRGYGPQKRLAVKVSTRNIPVYRDAAVILIDHLRDIYIDGELEPMDTGIWFAKLARKDYTIGMNITANPIDDPDQTLYENYACDSERNYSHYCNAGLEKLFDAQSSELDLAKRKAMVWEIDRRLQDDVARPIIMYPQGGTCWHDKVHGFVPMTNSAANGYRFEDLWIEH